MHVSPSIFQCPHTYEINIIFPLDVNAEVTYSIVSGNETGHFAINPSTGQIDMSTSISIDRELRDTHMLVIEAVDGGTPALSSSCLVQIVVDDVNDNAAVFSPVDFSVSLDENQVYGLILSY